MMDKEMLKKSIERMKLEQVDTKEEIKSLLNFMLNDIDDDDYQYASKRLSILQDKLFKAVQNQSFLHGIYFVEKVK